MAQAQNDIDFDFRFLSMKSSSGPLDRNLTEDN